MSILLRDTAKMSTWKTIPDFGEHYQINREGVVRVNPDTPRTLVKKGVRGYHSTKKAGDIISPSRGVDGYLRVNLTKACGKKTSCHVHRLLMLTFCPPEDTSLQVNHKDGDKSNNSFENLEWCTQLENLKHAWVNNLRPAPQHRKVNEEQVLEIRKMRESSDKTLAEIGELYGVTQHAIWRIIHRKTWKHI